ncbi:similar to Saccharomyces cerevisiae YDR159W SAC3 Nuclear pore-associated protein [Maudiozyma barnettii]|uniref:Nuclear mRNA export factor n=1 Tax=Maudiozyma barnettii TaxID=61262 RepID=A0A8H2VHP9_9SACH|nr:Sac3p [Kazachstania barnettii]CAB4255672.1 similar to Saccharomyces cerevisiae YDR159W SAC3 Nuclear pore-associated protein [Kazachstania barnettii]CAD1784233.1 similar to Saccharomyces cerevisiae YDR159W SAC3 Nuclear pore-associated protein [Kazachstania barnettii]
MGSSFGSVVPSSSFNFGATSGQNPFHNKSNTNSNRNTNNSASSGKGNFSNQNFFQKDKQKKNKKNLSPKKSNETNSVPHKRFMMSHDRGVLQVGSLLRDPTAMGFAQRTHSLREVPKFLISQQPQLKPKKFKQDHWDRINQTKMLNLEESIQDMTELYEKLKKMRDTERTIMEDKGLVDKADSAKDLNDAIVFQGTCLDMCPIFERARRNVEYTVYSYEKDAPDDKKASRSKSLKVFARPAAAAAPPLPSDVRPPHILVKTLDYLVDNLLPTLPDSEGFLWDRMRSIRQDFTYQNYCGPEAVDCNERIVRIHLLIIHVMVKSQEEFSLQQELEQLHKSLITLSEIYDDVRANGGSSPNEAEFRAYALLSKIRDPQYDKAIQDLPAEILQNDLIQLALCFRRIISNSSFVERGYMRTENCLNLYAQYFKLIQSIQVPFLLASFLEIYLNEVRFYAVKALSHSMNKKHKPIPTIVISGELMFNNLEELTEFCQYYTIDMTDEGVDLKSLTTNSHRLPEKKPLRNHYLACVDEKLNATSYSVIINSGKPNIDTLKYNTTGLQNVITIEEEPQKTRIPDDGPTSLPKTTGGLETSKDDIKNQEVGISSLVPNSIPLTNKQGPVTNILQTRVVPFNTVPSIHEGFTNTPSISKTAVNLANNTVTLEPKSTHLESSVSNKHDILAQNNKNENLEKEFEKKQLKLEETKRNEIKRKQEKEEEKRKRKIIAQDSAIAAITNTIIKDVIQKQCQTIVNSCINSRNNRIEVLDDLAVELYDAFIHEKIYFVFLEAKSDSQRNKYLQKPYFKRWSLALKKKQGRQEALKKHKTEIQNLERQLGVPALSKSKRLLNTPTTTDVNSSFLLNSSIKNKNMYSPVTNESNQFSLELIKKKGSLWKPFDLKKLYLDRVATKYLRQMKQSSDIFIYSKSWNTVSSSWILSKFDLKDSKSVAHVGDGNLTLNIKCIDERFNPTDFTETQLVIFNTGVTDDSIFDLEMKLKQDGEDLIKLITGVALNTNTNFNLLLIYWESSETQLSDSTISKHLKLNRIDRNFNGILENIGFVKVNEKNPDISVKKGLVKISESFQYKLTDRGKYHESLNKKRNQRVTSQEKQLRATKSIDEKMKIMLETENVAYNKQISEGNTYAHLQPHIAASRKLRKRKLPILVSETKSSKFKTPMGSRMRYSSHTSTDSLPQQSHLAIKVRNGVSRVASHHGPLPSGTPSHSTNVPNTSYDSHVIPSFGSSVGNNTSFHGISHIPGTQDSNIFHTPSNAITGDESVIELQQASVRKSSDIQELKSLIASVKKRVKPHE